MKTVEPLTLSQNETVNIRPGVNVLSVLRHLNYKPWYAIGEFVDNAVQSAIEHWDRLVDVNGEYRLVVDIGIDNTDGGRIVIRDNACGISVKDYQRAFRTAELPPSRTGLSEFGMGMKSAGFWFTTNWTVRTKALGERRAGTINFDLVDIMENGLEQLPVQTEPAKPYEHYTELTLVRPQKMPVGRTIGKIKEHLTGMYRQYLRDGRLELIFGGEPVVYKEPNILVAPHPKTPSGRKLEWKKAVDLRLPGQKRVYGFVAIREEGSVSDAGLALFRRNRLIIGSGDEGYRPEVIFGRSNDFRYQRIFGELHIEGFGVSHTKDGIQWEELEDEFLLKLKQELNKEPLPLLRMALEYRARPRTQDISRNVQAAVASTAAVLQNAGPVIQAQRKQSPASLPLPESLPQANETAGYKEFRLKFQAEEWVVSIEVVNDPAIGSWLEVSDHEQNGKLRRLRLRINFCHPFMQRFAGTTSEQMEPFIRIGAGLAIAEFVSRDQGVKQAGWVRRHLNELLRSHLSAVGGTST